MKKVTITLLTITGLSSTSYAMMDDHKAQSGFVFEGQVSANITPQQTFDNVEKTIPSTKSEDRNIGPGVGLFIGYDYAIDPNMTVGGKVGYQYLYEVNYLKMDGTPDDFDLQLNINNFPILATWKYFFNNGWLVGVDGGIVIQKWTVAGKDTTYNQTDNHSSNWSVAPMAGISGGYKFDNGLAVTGSLSYIFGKSTDNIDYNDDSKALAVWTLGLNLSYTLPM